MFKVEDKVDFHVLDAWNRGLRYFEEEYGKPADPALYAGYKEAFLFYARWAYEHSPPESVRAYFKGILAYRAQDTLRECHGV